MIFFSRQMSERLAKLGCKSESRFQWHVGCRHEGFGPFYEERRFKLGCRTLAAFFQNDLTGCSEQARENAMIVWGSFNVSGECPCCCNDNPTIPSFARHRHAMLDAPDAEKYLEETLA